MRDRFGRLPSPSMAVAFVALLAALGGTAVALPGNNSVTSGDIRKGAVGTSDIKNNAIRTQDIRNSTVRGKDVRNNSLTGADVTRIGGGDVTDNSLTGADINESTLGQVPNAATLGGQGPGSFESNSETIPFSFFTGEGDRQIVRVGPLTLSSHCDLDTGGNDVGELRLATSANNSTMDDNNGDEFSDFDVADSPAEIYNNTTTANTVEFESTNDGSGVIAAAPDGSALTTTNEGVGLNVLGRPDTCYFAGVVVVLGGSAS
jgi:hypothetical protein